MRHLAVVICFTCLVYFSNFFMSQFCPKCKHNNLDNSKLCVSCGSALTGFLGRDAILQGRYRVKDLLGSGGMGAVYLATDQKFKDVNVAIKENFAIDKLSVELFKTEAEVLRKLHHPNLPKVYDLFFETSGKQYLVMEYIDGEDLQKILQRQGTILETQALVWANDLLKTLDYLHTQPNPILHRDIKPSNIKIASDGRLILVDFGLVKMYTGSAGESLTLRLGTDGYAPPEQASEKEKSSPCSDLYAVGATLYHLLSGKIPLSARERAANPQRLVPLQQLHPEITAKTENLVYKAMALPMAERFQSAREMQQAILSAQQTGRIRLWPLKLPSNTRAETFSMALGVMIIVIGIVLFVNSIIGGSQASPSVSLSVTARVTETTLAAVSPTEVTVLPTQTPTAPKNDPTATQTPTRLLALSSVTPLPTIATPTRTPTVTGTATQTPPTETAAPTLTPTYTRTSLPTRTRIPTATPIVETPIAFATATPIAPAASAARLSPPSLISPPAGASFSGWPGPTFSWTSAGSLGAFDYYQFQIQHSQGFDVICTKNTSTQARSYVPSLTPSRWTVNVVRLGSAISDGAACSGSIVASAGEVRSLNWTQNSPAPSNPGSSNPTPRPSQAQPQPQPQPQPTATPVTCVPGPGIKC